MRFPSLVPVLAGAALLAPTSPPAAAVPHGVRREAPVSAAELRARTRDCAQVSHGRYREDAGGPAEVRVCANRGAVFWKADMDIDCDGRPGTRCNRRTDPDFSPATAFPQSDGRPLDAERLPYIVIPAAGPRWDHRAHGVRGGSVAAVLYGERVRYAVVGDTGPRDLIGEASYATARALGIDPDPHAGGASSGVTYIVFPDTRARPIEDHDDAVAQGEELARKFVGRTG
ncbi:glycoside hydrolase family 75 protein [Streptomyces griseoluteus]|uniref:glycoside hydrolase family 75 protein n=1 Tax=Streptomyces griseoluteus TaxID=29306 RepID=UPI0036E9AB01